MLIWQCANVLIVATSPKNSASLRGLGVMHILPLRGNLAFPTKKPLGASPISTLAYCQISTFSTFHCLYAAGCLWQFFSEWFAQRLP